MNDVVFVVCSDRAAHRKPAAGININRIIGLHIINPGRKMDRLIRRDNLQVTNNTPRQMDSQIRRNNKNNTELIAAEANGVIALRIDVLIASPTGHTGRLPRPVR